MSSPNAATTSDLDAEINTEVLVIGGGPAGAAAAIHAADLGLDTLIVEADELGRDKTCGDGLTPRAIYSLTKLGLAGPILSQYTNRGLHLHGYGGSVRAPWPDSTYGNVGSAMPRAQFDAYLLQAGIERGVRLLTSTTATDVDVRAGTLHSVTVTCGAKTSRIRTRWAIIADGVRSPLGKKLGRRWHRSEVYGIAARSYVSTPRHRDEWMHSHVELLDEKGHVLPGYGWIFPLADGTVNLGCGALSTSQRPAKLNTKKILDTYADSQRADWQLGTPTAVSSALLPMGGAVNNVAGKNWMLIGDAAAGVNPLNGEGIDYGLDMAELAIILLNSGYRDFSSAWPATLRQNYGEAFLLARTAARLLTYPRFLPAVGPLALRSPIGARLMPAAARLMANLISDEDRDLIARMWRAAGGVTARLRSGSPLWGVE